MDWWQYFITTISAMKKVALLEGDNLVVFYNLSAYEICLGGSLVGGAL